ncbi:MAG: cation diffusion facilitator family transporter [Campylobacterales bacterium]|nr:cation diffusion facilitator family transporter [Campylobacterales bacterium]
MTLQKKATLVSTTVAFLLSIIKLIAGILSGNLALLASAIDSILDMFVSIFNYFAIVTSEKQEDKDFNYGRGKIEALASLLEGLIITFSGIFLLYKAYEKYINSEKSLYLNESLIIMIISLFATIFLVLYLNKVAKITKSMVIKADAMHYKVDVYSNLAVLLSLILVSLTSYEIIDVIVSVCISLYIIYSAYELIHNGFLVLLDKSLEEDIVKNIENIIKENDVNNFHLLKTREAANKIFVEVHLVFDKIITLYEAHKISDEIEENIKLIDNNKEWIINIHLDPYDDSEKKHER